MRIDRFLWSVRYYKTRNIASIACKKGHVKVNGITAKPSKEVYPQDKINVRKNQVNYQLLVNDLPQSRVGAKLVDIYRTDLTPKSEFEVHEMSKLSASNSRQKGEGRPTKKDRRDLDDFYFENE